MSWHGDRTGYAVQKPTLTMTTAAVILSGLPRGCHFPDIISEPDCPEPLKHRFFYGGTGTAKLSDFEFIVMRLYRMIPCSNRIFYSKKDERTTLSLVLFSLWTSISFWFIIIFLGIEFMIRSYQNTVSLHPRS